jgi:hypothetical protein
MNGKAWLVILTDRFAKDRLAGFRVQAQIRPGDRRHPAPHRHGRDSGGAPSWPMSGPAFAAKPSSPSQASVASSIWLSAMAGIAQKAIAGRHAQVGRSDGNA